MKPFLLILIVAIGGSWKPNTTDGLYVVHIQCEYKENGKIIEECRIGMVRGADRTQAYKITKTLADKIARKNNGKNDLSMLQVTPLSECKVWTKNNFHTYKP
jgi:hypothetical protein